MTDGIGVLLCTNMRLVFKKKVLACMVLKLSTCMCKCVRCHFFVLWEKPGEILIGLFGTLLAIFFLFLIFLFWPVSSD